jgi:hypothetical protein
MYYNKSLVKATEKAFINLRRDLSEVEHLQNSRNIRSFLQKSQEKFEKTIYLELQNLGLQSCQIIQNQETKIMPVKSEGKLDLIIIGLDNLAIFSHALTSLSFGLALLEGEEILATSLAMPAINGIIFDKGEEIFILDNEGLSKKVKMMNATNIAITTIVAGVDHENFDLQSFLPQRDILPISSSSLIYDTSLLLQNKLDLVLYKRPREACSKVLENLVIKAGGSSFSIGDKFFLGKKSVIKSIQKTQESI